MSSGSSPSALRETLAESPAFCMLTRELIDEVFSHMQPRDFPSGSVLIEQGQPADSLMVLVKGTVEVRMVDHEGVSHRIANLGRSAIIGEMALLTKEPRSANVIATSAVRALCLGAQAFDHLAAQHPEVSVVLTEILADRLGRQDLDTMGGKTVENYRILRCLGRGGMAVVYEAIDQSLDGEGGEQHLALKMMNHRLLFRAGAMARFQREADILMGLDHRNITRVSRCFSAFRTSFLAMEYCDGLVLSDYLREQGPLPEADVRGCLGQLAGALDYLHGQEVMHRDLKPSNVLMTQRGLVKLTDFGLARQWTPSTISTSITTEGTVVGTPLYMAPEQILGRDVGPEADLYAFGCIGLELLLGRLPFVSKDLAGLIDEKRQFRMPAARDLGLAEDNSLYEVLADCLSREPGQRRLDAALVATWAQPFGLA